MACGVWCLVKMNTSCQPEAETSQTSEVILSSQMPWRSPVSLPISDFVGGTVLDVPCVLHSCCAWSEGPWREELVMLLSFSYMEKFLYSFQILQITYKSILKRRVLFSGSIGSCVSFFLRRIASYHLDMKIKDPLLDRKIPYTKTNFTCRVSLILCISLTLENELMSF